MWAWIISSTDLSGEKPRVLARAGSKRQRGQPADDQFVRVLPEGDVLSLVTDEAGKSFAHPLRLLEIARPLVVDELRRIEPGALLRRQADVGPGLMRMASQENPLGHAEARIVGGERRRFDHGRDFIGTRRSLGHFPARRNASSPG